MSRDQNTLNDKPSPVEVRGLVTRYDKQLIHDHLDLTVHHGEILGIVGSSGSGKSVLLNSIIGLKAPEAGEVRVFGHEIYKETPTDLLQVKRRWGVLFQSNALFSKMTVEENVSVPLFEHTQLPEDIIIEIARLKIALAGLPPEAADLRPSELSGGMQKRAAVARALALDPELLLLDEPTSGLDTIAAAQFDRLIVELTHALGLTVVFVTHDLDSLYAVCDRIAVLADRKVVAAAPVGELRRSDHPWIQRYFTGRRGEAAASAARRWAHSDSEK